MIRSVLAKSNEEPICDACARALGAQTTVNVVATVSTRNCCLCDEERDCASIRDWSWPAQKRPLHADADDYSELETLLTRPVSGVPSQQPTEK